MYPCLSVRNVVIVNMAIFLYENHVGFSIGLFFRISAFVIYLSVLRVQGQQKTWKHRKNYDSI